VGGARAHPERLALLHDDQEVAGRWDIGSPLGPGTPLEGWFGCSTEPTGHRSGSLRDTEPFCYAPEGWWCGDRPLPSREQHGGHAPERFQPATIVDVGASDGRWSDLARTFWPKATLLCIEADERHAGGLAAFKARTGATVVQAMVGAVVGTGSFCSSSTDPFGGCGCDETRPGSRTMPCTTVDHEVSKCGAKPPYLLKLDTHGYEAQILEGAAKVLKDAVGLVIEAYTCTLQPRALRFWELCRDLTRAGFAMTDLANPLRRPLDGRLWQFDGLWERAYAPLVGVARYR
jgi:FkbM family methyltransferase